MPRAVGIILPSSNRIVERATRAILADMPGVDACFTRVPYAGHPPDGYDMDAFRQAALLLAEARPEVIVWNATRGALIGFEPDRRLVAMIEQETGIACATTALATVDYLRAEKLTRIAMLGQGDEAGAERVRRNFGREGVDIVASHNLGITDNFAAAEVSQETIEEHVRRLALTPGIDAVLVWSTNLAGYRLAIASPTSARVKILDSTVLGILAALPHLATLDGSPGQENVVLQEA